MQFLYHPEAGQAKVFLQDEYYRYIFKVRRHKKGETVALRNLKDGYLYSYLIEDVTKKEAILTLVYKEFLEIKPKRFFHLLWCVIDPKTIEKTLPMLNELGVSKISFVYCKRSQKNFRLKLDKLHKILINSNQQCGRSDIIELEVIKSLKEALSRYENIVLIDFSDNYIDCADNIQRAFIGPEGGFSEDEREYFTLIKGLDTKMILRSESAAVAVASKVLV